MKKFIYRLALKLIVKQVINSSNKLTVEYLIRNGWRTEYDKTTEKTFYVEPNIKDRDKVSIDFENHYYRVFHGKERTFVALETSVEWLQLHLLLIDKHKKFSSPNEIVNCGVSLA
jgi:hypothetical protein